MRRGVIPAASLPTIATAPAAAHRWSLGSLGGANLATVGGSDAGDS